MFPGLFLPLTTGRNHNSCSSSGCWTTHCPPFALLRRRTPGHDHDTVELLIGAVHEAEHLADLPVGDRPALALVPFRQIRERGFDVRDDGTPLSVLVADETYELPLADVLDRAARA